METLTTCYCLILSYLQTNKKELLKTISKKIKNIIEESNERYKSKRFVGLK
ncbi:hypothetical protein DBT_2211 [Dissulfuribacter thermophilus]|uniref:Uncharacterized protein n=1 Tax=Dissulfuribacter thermophilus TaxID=1156395 RepID=A0A1B9F320_9BACT|nr:hypothetical protein DBT_2211 [Dissulfuribacter thermophilus]